MIFRHSLRLLAVASLVGLGGCAVEQELPGEPSFYRSLATTDAKIDAATAASMISGYRSNNGLTMVTVDPELMKLAEAQAQAMASRDKLDHNVSRAFDARLKAQGYRAKACQRRHCKQVQRKTENHTVPGSPTPSIMRYQHGESMEAISPPVR